MKNLYVVMQIHGTHRNKTDTNAPLNGLLDIFFQTLPGFREKTYIAFLSGGIDNIITIDST
jgi:hypothetical protein